MTEHVSHYELDALRLGKLEAARADAVRAHVEACAKCARERAALEQSAVEFREKFDPAKLAEETLAKVSEPSALARFAAWVRGGSGTWLVPAGALAALVLMFFVIAPSADDTRLKGSGRSLEIFVLDRGAPIPIDASGAPLGAALAVRYDAGAPARARFVWESAPGKLDALYPGPGEPAMAIDAAGARWLDQSVELDRETQTTETLHAVFCDHDFDHDAALRILAGGESSGCRTARADIAKQRGAPP